MRIFSEIFMPPCYSRTLSVILIHIGHSKFIVLSQNHAKSMYYYSKRNLRGLDMQSKHHKKAHHAKGNNLDKLGNLLDSLEPDTLIKKEAIPLFNKLLLLRSYLNKSEKLNESSENYKLRYNIERCARLMILVIKADTPENEKIQAQKALEELIYTNDFEIQTNDTLLMKYANYGLNAVVNRIRNGFNWIYPGDAGRPLPRARINNINPVAHEVQQFINAASFSTAHENLADLMFTFEVKQESKPTLYLSPALALALCNTHKMHESILKSTDLDDNTKLIIKEEQTKARDMVQKLIELNSKLSGIAENKILHPAAKQALVAQQSLVIELLQDLQDSSAAFSIESAKGRKAIIKEKKESTKRLMKMSDCIAKTIDVLEDPGNKDKVIHLEKAMSASDYTRFRRNRERSSYAVIHSGVSSSLTIHTLVEIIIAGALSLVDPLFSLTLAAEIASTVTGFCQFHLYGKKEADIEESFYFSTMQNLVEAAYLDTSKFDWANATDKKDIIDKWFSKHPDEISELVDLKKTILDFKTSILETKPQNNEAVDFIVNQAKAVLDSAEDLLIEFIHATPRDIKRINKLKECIVASNEVLKDPGDAKKVDKLVHILTKKEFEAKKIIKDERKFAKILLFASAVLFLITIPAAIFSLGATSGTVLSPIMIMAMGIKHWKHSDSTEQTAFSREAGKMADLAKLNSMPEEKKEKSIKNTLDKPSEGHSLAKRAKDFVFSKRKEVRDTHLNTKGYVELKGK